MKIWTLVYYADWEGGATVITSEDALIAAVEEHLSWAEQYTDETPPGRLGNDNWLNEAATYVGEHGWKVQHYDIEQHEIALPIQPGDMVSHRTRELDDREVVSVGRDFLTLDIMGRETDRLPKDNYVTSVPAEGAL